MKILSVIVALTTIRWLVQGNTAHVDQYEILAAGDGSIEKPYGQVFTVSPFVAKTYFEYNPEGPPRTLELFTGAKTGGRCSSGTLLSDSLYATAFLPGPTNYTASTSNGIIGTAEITIADIEATPAYTSLADYTAKIQLCWRTSIKIEFDSTQAGEEYVSFVDTQLNLNIDYLSTFSHFKDTVLDIESVSANHLVQNITRSVDVEAFLCASGTNASSTHRIGQSFTVCVRPLANFATEGYVVDGFTSVTCNNSAWSRRIVDNSKPSSELTTIVHDPSSYLSTSGEEAGSAAKAFQTVVTAGIFKGSEASFKCSGEVSLNNTNITRRRLWTTTSGSLLDTSVLGREESDQSTLVLGRRPLQETQSGGDDGGGGGDDDDDDDDEDTNPNHASIGALHTPSSPPLQISHNATKLHRNKTIHDLFDVHQLIGEGGFGKVYRAIRRRDGVEVALKSIPIYRPDDHEESLHREVSAMAALSDPGHPHVCRLYHPPMRDHSHSYLAMEFIGGGELFEQLCEKGPFSECDAARFLRQFADGLRYIHSKGYVHADLKPENLLMGAEQTCLKIVDFGGSVPDNDESDVRLPHHRTVAYSPPESLAAAKDGGGAVTNPTPEGDMFAAGVIVYTVLTGTHPFDRTNQASDAAISRAIAECLFSLDQTGAGAGESTQTSEYLGRHVFDHRTEGLSPSSVELMKRLLHPRPEGRLTSSEFCTHPWILGHTATTHCLGHHPRFRQFWRRRFRVAILEKFWGTVVAHHNQQNKQHHHHQQQQQQQRRGMNPRETQGKKPKLKRPVLRRSQSLSLKDSEAIFRSMDLNGDGTVSLEEMKRCMMGNSSVVGGDGTSKFKQYMLDDIFSSVDEDGSGGIDLGEFQRVMAKPLPGIIDAGCHLGGGGNESLGSSHDNEHVRGCILQRFGRIPTDDEAAARVTLRKIFDSMDINNDGVLQLSEAITVLRETPGLDEDMISAWADKTDIDLNGEIDFEEFCAAMMDKDATRTQG